MNAAFATLVARESTHGVYRHHVQVRLHPGGGPDGQARLLALGLRLLLRARAVDPQVDFEIRDVDQRAIGLEFVSDKPERIRDELNAWVAQARGTDDDPHDTLIPG